jgi:peptidoglycan/xylan/chitin deacetylase (PgdA/CDA1 family)
MKAAIKRAVLGAAEATGVTDRAGRSEWRRRRLLMLCYHGVSVRDEHLFNPELYVSVERLRARFSALRDMGASVIPLGEGLSRLEAGTLPPCSVVVTFDDGASNFVSQAVPLLREFAFPATVYVATHYVMHQLPVWNMAARYLAWLARDGAVHTIGDLSPDARTELFGNGELAGSILDAFLARWSKASSIEQDAAVSALARALRVDATDMRATRRWHLMTPEEIAALPADLVSVQLHTHRHRQPSDRQAYSDEVLRNQALIESITGRPARHFCYPSGVVEPAFPGYLRALGVESAVTCEPGLASPGSDVWRLPRLVDTMDTPLQTFRAWVAGTMGWLKKS